MMDWARANALLVTGLLFLTALIIWGGVIVSVPLIANDWMLRWALLALLLAGALRLGTSLHTDKD